MVGVDGLNVYEREEVVGRSDADTGSILSPWDDRTLRGWQVGHHRAERFVFSPPEWSEGEGRTDSEIGLLTVQVYREWQRPRWESRGERDGAAGGPPSASAPAPRRQGDEAKEAPEARAQAARPPIGTTSMATPGGKAAWYSSGRMGSPAAASFATSTRRGCRTSIQFSTTCPCKSRSSIRKPTRVMRR